MRTQRKQDGVQYLPELMEPKPGVWDIHEVDIQESAVDTQNRKAWVPKAHTPAQRLARLHEGGHVKYSPRDWQKRVVRTLQAAQIKAGKPIDPRAVEKILKMLEENRIDWLLWDRHSIDLRPAREVLDWSLMPDPSSVLFSLGMCLQLAWTVWASRGLSAKSGIPNPPPVRAGDPATEEYFDKCWSLLTEENMPLAKAMIAGCMRMYTHPTHEMRDQVAAELSTFFPLEAEEEEKPPPQKKEEQKAQDKAEAEEQAHQEYLDEQETGVGGDLVAHGRVQIHDHTASLRRPSVRIARRVVPVSQGPGLRFAHRYFVDKAIFGQRLLTEAGIMVDGSSSMSWTDEDMRFLMTKLPAVQIGIYSGVRSSEWDHKTGLSYVGRICIIAKQGRFARFDKIDPEMNGSNDVDLEALWMLAKWPRPRLWLSDGEVCGGLHTGPSKFHKAIGRYYSDGALYEKCDAWMKAHEILRVPDRETMHKLLNRERVTLYRTCAPGMEFFERRFNASVHNYGDIYPVKPEPVTFQL